MSNARQRVSIIGSSFAELTAALDALEHDIEMEAGLTNYVICAPDRIPRGGCIVCDPSVLRRGKGKRGSADWKQHLTRRGKFKRRNR